MIVNFSINYHLKINTSILRFFKFKCFNLKAHMNDALSFTENDTNNDAL